MEFIIKEMFAFCTIDKGDEGVIGMYTNNGWMPLVGADVARVESLKPIAQKIAKEAGKVCVLKRFKLVEETTLT